MMGGVEVQQPYELMRCEGDGERVEGTKKGGEGRKRRTKDETNEDQAKNGRDINLNGTNLLRPRPTITLVESTKRERERNKNGGRAEREHSPISGCD
jgi:hypothetical protein